MLFRYRLAAHLGMTVRRMLREMDAMEFTHWEAWSTFEPLGEERQDLRMALQTSAIVQALGGKGKLEDYLVDFIGVSRRSQAVDLSQMSKEEVREFARGLHAQLSESDQQGDQVGTDERGGESGQSHRNHRAEVRRRFRPLAAGGGPGEAGDVTDG